VQCITPQLKCSRWELHAKPSVILLSCADDSSLFSITESARYQSGYLYFC
jgi:hypothetical protein